MPKSASTLHCNNSITNLNLEKMKKIALLLFVSGFLSTGIIAQEKHVNAEEKTLKNTIEDKKEDRKDMGKDLTKLKVKSAIGERKEVRRHRKSIKKQKKHLKHHGVHRPVKKAKLQLEKEQLEKKDKI